jgi:hypothetical protein
MTRFVILLLLAASFPLSATPGSQTFTGIISDSMCGSDHKAMNVSPHSKCVLECVKSSSNVKYVLLVGKNKYTLSDQQTPERFAAQKVKVTGRLSAACSAVDVKSIELVK